MSKKKKKTDTEINKMQLIFKTFIEQLFSHIFIITFI